MRVFRFSRMVMVVVVVVVTVTFSHLSPVFCQFSILNFQFSFSLSFTLFVQKRARNKERTTFARSAFSPAGRVSGDDDDYDVVVVDDDAIGNVDILGGGFVVIIIFFGF